MSGRIIIAGTSSGSGKTTLTLAILAALKARGLNIAAAKCGPDYVDPSLHREVLKLPSYNLDTYFLDKTAIRQQILRHPADLSLIEGVMGYYDGSGKEARGSTYQLAQYTESPAVLVLSAKGMYQSVAAILQGFANYRQPSYLKAVIFNGVSAGLAKPLSAFAEEAGLISLGVFPKRDDLVLPEGRLGLAIPEKEEMLRTIELLAQEAEKFLDLDSLIEIANTAPAYPELSAPEYFEQSKLSEKPVLAIAKDAAFCKLYPDNVDVLEDAGFAIKYFSPLEDRELPQDTSALYLPGGYPENYLRELSANESMKKLLYEKISEGLPTIAEHGGAAYLHEAIEGQSMLAFIPAKVEMAERLQNFGYAQMQAEKDSLICSKEDILAVHEFHYYMAEQAGEDFLHIKASGRGEAKRGHAGKTFYAGFAQLYFPAYPDLVKRWYQTALAYAIENKLAL